jgi:hypothetical protein
VVRRSSTCRRCGHRDRTPAERQQALLEQ